MTNKKITFSSVLKNWKTVFNKKGLKKQFISLDIDEQNKLFDDIVLYGELYHKSLIKYNEIDLNAEQLADNDWVLWLDTGTKITVGRYHVEFLERLRALPYAEKIQLLRLEDSDLQKYVKEKKTLLRRQLLNFITIDVWYWRETGDVVEFTDSVVNIFFGVKMSLYEFMKKINRGGYTNQELKTYISLFTDGKEVYQKHE